MNGISILEKIISEEGNCCWASPSICNNCPLSKLTTYESGRFMSCVEAVGIENLTEEQADAKYKEVAINKLAELVLDDVIKDKDGS